MAFACACLPVSALGQRDPEAPHEHRGNLVPVLGEVAADVLVTGLFDSEQLLELGNPTASGQTRCVEGLRHARHP
jgi:hypothetical protein